MERYLLQLWRNGQTNPFPLWRGSTGDRAIALAHIEAYKGMMRAQGCYFTVTDLGEGKDCSEELSQGVGAT